MWFGNFYPQKACKLIFYMPQFDFYSYSIQIIWLFVFFILFYGLISLFYLPSFSEVLKIRNKLLLRAQKMKETAKVRKIIASECIKRIIKIGNNL
jgi:F0F1-type ATP synthase membrane subunit b/b'